MCQILGDVGAGAIVRAGGDVIVMGRLAGEVFAGQAGDRHAKVVAVAMEPSRIAIANVSMAGPDGRAPGHPEVASVPERGSIV